MAASQPAHRWRPDPAYALVGGLAVLGLLIYGEAVDPSMVFDPPFLLTALNFVFLTVVPLAGAALAVRAYRRTGAGAVLALGAGLLALGIGGGLIPAVLIFGVDANAGLTVHNGSVLVAGVLQFAAALAAVFGTALGPSRRRHVAFAYGGVLLLVGALVALTVVHALPAFWTGIGGTPVRAVVLLAAAAFWAGSAMLWLPAAVRDRAVPFLDRYIAGLLLMGLSLLALVAQQHVGNAVSWASRTGQYLAVLAMVGSLALALRPKDGMPELGVAILQATLPFRPIVESASDGVVVVRRDGRVAFANDHARALFGWTEDPTDRQLATLLPTSLPETSRHALTGADAPNGPLAVGDGRLVEVSVHGTGDASIRVLLLRDVTSREMARDELEARVRERTAELERANAAKDEFLGLVSHELRTPITTITASAALLARQHAADPDGLVADIEADAARLARIVDNLLALARLDAGRSFDTEPVALDRLADAVAERVRSEFRDRRIDVSVQRGVVVDGNPDQLAMVLRNYLVNAIRYSDASEAVELHVSSADRTALVEVLDSGPGISEADPMKLFEPFYRSPTTSSLPGIGIGLTVCRRIVESLGGSVAAASRLDGPGAVFSFALPLSTGDEPLGDDPVDEAAIARSGVGP